MTKKEIQKIVTEFLRKNRLQVPIDLNKVAHLLNAETYIEPFPTHKVDGLTLFYKNKHYILLNLNKPPTRRRFTHAHEIAHIMLKHYIQSPVNFSTHDEAYMLSLHTIQTQANILASELLIPTWHLKEMIFKKKCRNLQMLLKYYNVSKDTLQIKLKEINADIW